MTFACVGLGGNRRKTPPALLFAESALRGIPSARLAGVSGAYVSAPVGCPGSQADYCNAAAMLQTVVPPRRIFASLRAIERRAQKRRRRKNAPRVLDADYLSHGTARLRSRILRLPHPRMGARAFVLAPLSELTGTDFAGIPRSDALSAALPKLLREQSVSPMQSPVQSGRMKKSGRGGGGGGKILHRGRRKRDGEGQRVGRERDGGHGGC